MKYNQSRRDAEDKDTEAENKDIMLLRRIIEADVKIERQGRIKPERLSPEEQEIIVKWGIQSVAKKVEIQYWLKIGELMAENKITVEQAREKMFKDMLNSGHTKEAQALRTYQNIIHPLKTDKKQQGSNPKPPAST